MAFALPALYAARDYGLAFDSHFVFPYGDALLGYLAGRGPWPLNPYTADREAYGPLGALGAALTSSVLHDRLGLTDALVGHHVFLVVCGAALVGLTARLGTELGGGRVGWLAAALLATSPRFFAEAENNASDLPAALAWTAVLAGLARAFLGDRTRPLVGAAIALGALGAIRVPNLAVLPLVPILWLAVDADARRAARRLLARGRWRSLPGLVALTVGCMWLFRPLAWSAPRVVFWTIVERLLMPPPGIWKGVSGVLFWGSIWPGGPRSYHPVMLAITTPLPVLVAFGVGAAVVWRRTPTAGWLLVSWLVVAVGRYVVLGRGNYDGVRHVLDGFPALAVLEAFGADAALAALARGVTRPRFAGRALGILVTLVLLLPGATAIWRLHPYPVAYYNALVGGLRGAAGKFETEYSGAAYREALAWAAAHLDQGDVLWITRSEYQRRLVEIEAAYLDLSWLRVRGGTALEMAARVRQDGGRVYAVQSFRLTQKELLPAGLGAHALPLVHEVRREDVPLLRIREVRPEALQAFPGAATR